MDNITGTAASLIDGVLTLSKDIPVYDGGDLTSKQIDTLVAGNSYQVFSYIAKKGTYINSDFDCLQLYEADGSMPGFGTPRMVRIDDLNGNVSNVVQSDAVKSYIADLNAGTSFLGLPALSWSNWYWYAIGAFAGVVMLEKLIEKF